MSKIIKPKIINTNTDEIIKARDIADELHKPIIKHFVRRKVLAFEPDEIWAIDLCEMPNYEGYKYIFTIIDVYTKYGWAIPLTNKKGSSTAHVLDNLIQSSKRCPKMLWQDLGKEFWNKDFKTVTDKYNITMYNTESELKCTVVERWNRTLKEAMEKEITIKNLLEHSKSNKINWVDILRNIVHDYNNKVHSTIKMSPVNAIKSENRKLLDDNWHKHLQEKSSTKTSKFNGFAIGDNVRIYRFKTHFEKGYKPRWTEEIFRIKTIKYTTPVTYVIEDMDGEEIIGSFYAQELQKSKF